MHAPRLLSPYLLAVAAGIVLLPLSLAGEASAQVPMPTTPVRPAAPRGVAQPQRPTVPARSPDRPSDTPSPGERLYMRGLSVAGAAIDATVQGDIHVKSTEMACANCHRRSGMGTAEGPLVVPAIANSVLFSPVTQGAPQLGQPRATGAGTRPAYGDDSLLRALRDGVDPAGRTLSPTMPRYALTDADGKALATYLRSLGATRPPGVDEARVHIATIVTSRVSPARRASMLDVLRTFVRAKNGGTRREVRRRENGPWDMKQMYEGYRDWVLDEWELAGEPNTWPAQLETLYRQQPVYAIVSGIADEDWSPIDAFCARHRIPAVLPQTPLPPGQPAGGFYSFYYSRGVALEAQAIADHLAAGRERPRAVRQVSRCGTPGEVAARALARDLETGAKGPQCVPPSTALSAETWRILIGDADTLVLWLDGDDLQGLESLAGSAAIDRVTEIYLSSTLLGDDLVRVPEAVARRVTLVDPFVPPDEFDAHAARSLIWMKANGIKPADRRVAVNALFAVVLAADALSAPRAIDSREYFGEIVEHMTNRSINPTAYPSVSFDPTRRFASSVCYLLKMPTGAGEAFRKVEK
jgi:mono/diheme cytochrome c family protein